MAKTANVLQVLHLFTQARHQVRVAEIARLLDVSSATAYRYVAELEHTGFIESAATGVYVLGPAIVELDRQIRLHDPLIAAASDIMRTLSERTGGTTILARLHASKVVCVDQVRGRHGPKAVSYERGRAMPLYRGATSTVILAQLDRDAIRALAERDASEIRKAGLPTNPQALAERLRALGEKLVAHTQGEVDADALGWAIAIQHGKHLLGSLSVVMSRDAPDLAPQRIAEQLRRAALRVQGRLDSLKAS